VKDSKYLANEMKMKLHHDEKNKQNLKITITCMGIKIEVREKMMLENPHLNIPNQP